MSATEERTDPEVATLEEAHEGRFVDELSKAMISRASRMLRETQPPTVRPGATERLITDAGLSATLSDEGTALQVRDARGHLVFELHDDGTATLSAPSGDLELRSRGGKVRLLGERGVELRGPTIELVAHQLRTRATHIETTARRAVERFGDFYQEVERTAEVRAKDIRHTARRTLLSLAKKLRMRADEDAKLQAEKVYLG